MNWTTNIPVEKEEVDVLEASEKPNLEAMTKPKKVKPKADPVNHPSHYTDGGIETIDYIEAKQLSYHLGNVVKYVSRAGKKGATLEDLEKAQWYLTREINRVKGSK